MTRNSISLFCPAAPHLSYGTGTVMRAPPGVLAGILAGMSWLVAKLPPSVHRLLGAWLGSLAGTVLRIRRAHVEHAMLRGGIRDPERAARAMYRSLGISVFEFMWLAGGDASRLDARIHIDPRSRRALDAARAHGRGIVLAATHTGNWDLAACAIARQVPLLVITKRLSVRALDHFWQTTRRRYGVRLAEARGAMKEARGMLGQGGAVAMMIDQVPLRARHGVPVEFFGAMAHADKAPAALAASTGAPLLVAAACRVAGDDMHHLHVLDVLYPDANAAWILEATRRATFLLEQFVREHPSEWLWLHRRWREPGISRLPAGDARPQDFVGIVGDQS